MHEFAVEIRDIWYSPNGGEPILKGIDLNIKRGSCTALIGPSGSGKTTLFKMIGRLIKPNKGSISLHGKNNDLKKEKVGYIPQQLGLVKSKTALENVLIGGHSRIGFIDTMLGVFPKKEVDGAMKFLEMVNLLHKAHEKVHNLSGGERQRVAISRALMQGPDVILADEFVSNLDIVTAREIMEMMLKVKGKDITLIISTHDISLARDFSETTVIIKNGIKIDEINSNELENNKIKEVFT